MNVSPHSQWPQERARCNRTRYPILVEQSKAGHFPRWSAVHLEGAVRDANREPPRSAPQLLVIPDRERVERLLRAACRGDLNLIALELERNQTLQFGEVNVLVAFVRKPGERVGPGLAIRHMMPGGEVTARMLAGAAEALAATINLNFKRYGGAWAQSETLGYL